LKIVELMIDRRDPVAAQYRFAAAPTQAGPHTGPSPCWGKSRQREAGLGIGGDAVVYPSSRPRVELIVGGFANHPDKERQIIRRNQIRASTLSKARIARHRLSGCAKGVCVGGLQHNR
jgi:hypothetical protein